MARPELSVPRGQRTEQACLRSPQRLCADCRGLRGRGLVEGELGHTDELKASRSVWPGMALTEKFGVSPAGTWEPWKGVKQRVTWSLSYFRKTQSHTGRSRDWPGTSARPRGHEDTVFGLQHG